MTEPGDELAAAERIDAGLIALWKLNKAVETGYAAKIYKREAEALLEYHRKLIALAKAVPQPGAEIDRNDRRESH